MSSANPELSLSDDYMMGLNLIVETGGIHQSEFWKELDVSSRKGSRIVTKLLDEDLIQRSETTYEGRKTYFLEPTEEHLDFSLLMAGNMLSPFIGEEEVNSDSEAFTQWLMNLTSEE